MKTSALISAAALTLSVAVQPAHAGPKTANDIQRATTFTAATIIGGIAGGPIGMIVGAIGGAYLGEQSKKGIANGEELASAETTIKELKERNQQQASVVEQLKDQQAKKLEFKVMFPTGEDELSIEDVARIESLAIYLKENTALKVRLDGHADPRGTDEYNNVLSEERARAVAKAFKERGIGEDRLDVHSHGSSFSMTLEANRDNYAFERRVDIEVYSAASETPQEVASHN